MPVVRKQQRWHQSSPRPASRPLVWRVHGRGRAHTLGRDIMVIEGREVEIADWGEFEVAWYPHGDVVFIALAENPRLLVAALRTLPPFAGST